MAVLVREFGLPLPPDVPLYVYPDEAGYAEGLAREGGVPAGRAAAIAAYSVGLGQHGRVFINEGALRGAPAATRLAILAHELTHVAQYELSGGRRGASEQWLREGMADWIACHVVDRLGGQPFVAERDEALRTVVLNREALEADPPDLVELGQPDGWEARHLRSGGHLAYVLAFLMTDELIRRHGFDRLLAYFRAFADSDDRFGNFQRAFGVSLPEFQREVLAQIRAPLAARGAGAAPGRLAEGRSPRPAEDVAPHTGRGFRP